ncbi:hypothetical protein PTKIN_Ptkin10aG0070100 [Pterospermum kingtungense]
MVDSEDRLLWLHTNNGDFCVLSAYVEAYVYLGSYQVCKLPSQNIYAAEAMRLEYQRLHRSGSSSEHVGVSNWEPPSSNIVKVNVDAGIRGQSHVACLGAVARDESGMVLFFASKTVGSVRSVLQVELLAI